FHLWRDVFAKPGTRRARTDARLRTGRQNRTGQLDPRRVCRPALQDRRDIRAADAGSEAIRALGNTTTPHGTFWGKSENPYGTAELRVSLQVRRSLAGNVPQLLWANCEGLCGVGCGKAKRSYERYL